MDIHEKINQAKQRRQSDDGGLAVMTPQDVTIAQFNSGAIALRQKDPIKYAALQRQILAKTFETLMVSGIDYGKVDGCGDKPMLFKAGAEKAASVFDLAIKIELVKEIEDWDKEFFSYTIKAIVSDRSNRTLAECIGSCNSKEKKYRYRWIPEKFATEDQKANKVSRKESKRYRGTFDIQVPNPDICDQVNTIMKMAEKRAMVGAVLIATNSSAFFGNAELEMQNDFEAPEDRPQWDTLDAEVIPEDVTITPAQGKRLWAIATQAGHTKESVKALLDTYGIESSKAIPVSQYDAICTQASNEALTQFFLAQVSAQASAPE